MKNIVINGRFLTRPMSGVQRTAYELVMAIDKLIDLGEIDASKFSFSMMYSGEIVNDISLKHIKLVKRGFLTGNLWEQLELPIYTAGKLLVSMCSIAPLMKRKQVVIIHDASVFVNKRFFKTTFRAWYNFALPVISRISAHIVTVSEFSRQELIKYLRMRPERISVMHNASDHIMRFGVPDKSFTDKIDSLKPYCLAVSNLAENKNFKTLAKAIAKIDFKDYNMLIAGGKMNTLSATLPDDAATYLGYVSNDELKYLYLNAALFIFPSIYEGFGIPPLEAMAMGCPVIASGTSSIPEVLQDACAYFNPHDADDMAKGIAQLIANPSQLEELKQRGYKHSQSFSWHKSALQFTNLLTTYYA